VWYEVNVYAGKRLLISGLITAVAAIVLYFVPNLSIDGYALAVMFFATISMVIGVWQSFRYLDTISK
jgi:hypothetical protein